MWTLLKQSPLAGKPTCEKVIVACPTSLVGNWANELVKWLGEGAINPLVVDGKGGKEVLIPAVRRWVQAKGRAVTLPGGSLRCSAITHARVRARLTSSHDCFVRDAADAAGRAGWRADRAATRGRGAPLEECR
jgi:hypothetical protein